MRLFVYGTLMDPDVMSAVCGHATAGESAKLADHRSRQLLGELYPGVVPFPGDSVSGILYEGIDRTQMALLDAFEGDMYRRTEVNVSLADRRVSAHAYVVRRAFRSLLSERPWSLDEFRSHGKAAFLSAYPGFSVLDGHDR